MGIVQCFFKTIIFCLFSPSQVETVFLNAYLPMQWKSPFDSELITTNVSFVECLADVSRNARHKLHDVFL